MKKYEYKIFNMSEATATMTWLEVLNKHGAQGWKVQDRVAKTCYLLIRDITPVTIHFADQTGELSLR